MEPRRDDGDDAGIAPQAHATLDAAMEPRRDDGDDSIPAYLSNGEYVVPQWSPVVTTGTTLPLLVDTYGQVMPQWSPVVTTGTTLKAGCDDGATGAAAMEPRRDDGDDQTLAQWGIWLWNAAMEPRRDDGDDAAGLRKRGLVLPPAAMEPRRDDGDDGMRAAREAHR